MRLDRVRNEGRTLRLPVAEVRDASGYFIFTPAVKPARARS